MGDIRLRISQIKSVVLRNVNNTFSMCTVWFIVGRLYFLLHFFFVLSHKSTLLKCQVPSIKKTYLVPKCTACRRHTHTNYSLTILWYLCHLFFLFTWIGRQKRRVYRSLARFLFPNALHLLIKSNKSQKSLSFLRVLHTNSLCEQHIL